MGQVKLGIYLPEDLQRRMHEAAAAGGRGAIRRSYERALTELLDALDGGEHIVFRAVRRVKTGAPQAL